jgi:plastocyanin
VRGAIGVVVLLALAGCGDDDAPSGHVLAPDGTTIAYQPQPEEPGWGSPGAQEATGGKVDVPIVDGHFARAVTTSKVGQIIVWTNDDDVPHTVRAIDAPLPRSGALPPGGRIEFTPKEPMRLIYECVLHPQTMRAELRVRPA